ncbi:MAG: hypothetical protein ABGY24_10915 [bacterium]
MESLQASCQARAKSSVTQRRLMTTVMDIGFVKASIPLALRASVMSRAYSMQRIASALMRDLPSSLSISHRYNGALQECVGR